MESYTNDNFLEIWRFNKLVGSNTVLFVKYVQLFQNCCDFVEFCFFFRSQYLAVILYDCMCLSNVRWVYEQRRIFWRYLYVVQPVLTEFERTPTVVLLISE